MVTTHLPPSSARGPALDLDGYQLRLPTFEGPLDVLLRLVEREHLPIEDVSLVAVTEQFLDHLAVIDGQEPALVSAFAAVAGRLLVLKSRALLPRPAPTIEEPDPDDLVRQLEEYRRVKAVAVGFAYHDRSGLGAFPRGMAARGPAADPPRLSIHPPEALSRALRRRLAVLAPPPTPAPLRPTVHLQSVIANLLRRLRPDRALSLRSFLHNADREHRLATFLAVLVLLRRRTADAEQPESFGDIFVSVAAPGHAEIPGP